MKHVCPSNIRAPFAGFCIPAKVAQRPGHQIQSILRLTAPSNQSLSRRPQNYSRPCYSPDFGSRTFTTSSPSLARKRWIKSTTKADAVPVSSVERPARTWQDYDPEVGIPLQSGELDQSTIHTIFGPDVDEVKGNSILRVVNYRRISGSLIDVGITFPPQSGINLDLATKALEYLRQEDPYFNEQDAGAAWAEAEVVRVEEQYMKRAEDLGLYKKSTDPSEPSVGEQGSEYGRDRHGESALVALRRANKARWMEEDRKKKEQESLNLAQMVAQGGASGAVSEGQSNVPSEEQGPTDRSADSMSLHEPVAKAWLQPVERKGWVKYYEEQATLVKDNKVPQMSTLRRLGPSGLLALGVLGACLTLHEMYTPPPKSARIFPDIPPAVATLGAITAINAAVFVAWRLPFLWRTMNKYFLVAPGYPFAMGIFGAQFGHQTFVHLFTNTLFLWPFGLMLHEDVGRGTFLAVYLGCGVTGAFGSLVYNVIKQRWLYYIFGSSTAVFGTMAATCLLRAEHDVKIMGYPVPITGMTLLGLFGGLELLAAWKGTSLGTDYAGHLTSIASGIVAAWYIRRRAAQTTMVRKDYVEERPVEDAK